MCVVFFFFFFFYRESDHRTAAAWGSLIMLLLNMGLFCLTSTSTSILEKVGPRSLPSVPNAAWLSWLKLRRGEALRKKEHWSWGTPISASGFVLRVPYYFPGGFDHLWVAKLGGSLGMLRAKFQKMLRWSALALALAGACASSGEISPYLSTTRWQYMGILPGFIGIVVLYEPLQPL